LEEFSLCIFVDPPNIFKKTKTNESGVIRKPCPRKKITI